MIEQPAYLGKKAKKKGINLTIQQIAEATGLPIIDVEKIAQEYT